MPSSFKCGCRWLKVELKRCLTMLELEEAVIYSIIISQINGQFFGPMVVSPDFGFHTQPCGDASSCLSETSSVVSQSLLYAPKSLDVVFWSCYRSRSRYQLGSKDVDAGEIDLRCH